MSQQLEMMYQLRLVSGDMDFKKDIFIKLKGMNGNDVTINTDSCSQRKEAYSFGALRPNGYDFTFHVSVLDSSTTFHD